MEDRDFQAAVRAISVGGAGISGGGDSPTGGTMRCTLWNGGSWRLAGGMGPMMGESERLGESSAWRGG